MTEEDPKNIIPNIRILISAGFTKKEISKSCNTIKNSVLKVLTKKRLI